MAVVYHWKHGWIPLDHTAALKKAKGDHTLADKMLADAPHAQGIQSRKEVAQALRDMPNVPDSHRAEARKHVLAAAAKHNAMDLMPGGGVKTPGDKGYPQTLSSTPLAKMTNRSLEINIQTYRRSAPDSSTLRILLAEARKRKLKV